MHCYKTNLFIFPYIRNWFSDTDKVWQVRGQRNNYCVDIPGHNSINSVNCPSLSPCASSRPGHYFSQESPQFPRHQPLGPDDTRDQELTFLWRDGWVGTGNTIIRSGSEGRVIYYRRYNTLCVFSLHFPQHNFLTESHKNPGLARVISTQSQPPLFLIITRYSLLELVKCTKSTSKGDWWQLNLPRPQFLLIHIRRWSVNLKSIDRWSQFDWTNWGSSPSFPCGQIMSFSFQQPSQMKLLSYFSYFWKVVVKIVWPGHEKVILQLQPGLGLPRCEGIGRVETKILNGHPLLIHRREACE